MWYLLSMRAQHPSVHVPVGGGEAMECEPKPEAPGSPERDLGPEDSIEAAGDGDGMKGVAEEADDGKKRKRKPYRPGERASRVFAVKPAELSPRNV